MPPRKTFSPPIADLAKQAHDAVQTLHDSRLEYVGQSQSTPSSVTNNVSANTFGAMTQPEASASSSMVNPSALSALASNASDKLAGINEMVNRILAPVHALEALKLTSPSTPQNQSSSSIIDPNSTPNFSMPPMPNTDPLPSRGGGRRARGMRRRTDTTDGTITLASNILLTPPSFSQRGRGGRARGRGSRGGRGRGGAAGAKRRRTGDTVTLSDSDESENFTPLTQSRSGRKIINTNPAPPVVIKIEDEETPVTKISPLAKRPSNNPAGRGAGKKRGGFRKTPGGPGAVCKNCGRGHSPLSNAIVFCDGCNTPWHQFCHDPPIDKEIVLIAEKEWFCSDCIVMKEEKSRLQGKIAGENLSMLEKRRYLQSLPSKELVSLLLHACRIHPDLPVFTPASNGDGAGGAAEEYYEDEDLLPYPKAGNGVSLKPEKDRLNLLLDEDFQVFSHSTTGIAEMVAAAALQAHIMSINGRIVTASA